jgi:hypothetical protein
MLLDMRNIYFGFSADLVRKYPKEDSNHVAAHGFQAIWSIYGTVKSQFHD